MCSNGGRLTGIVGSFLQIISIDMNCGTFQTFERSYASKSDKTPGTSYLKLKWLYCIGGSDSQTGCSTGFSVLKENGSQAFQISWLTEDVCAVLHNNLEALVRFRGNPQRPMYWQRIAALVI